MEIKDWKPTEEELIKFVKFYVKNYENIEASADEHARRFGGGEEARQALPGMMREMAGGPELYEASKKFLEGREETNEG